MIKDYLSIRSDSTDVTESTISFDNCSKSLKISYPLFTEPAQYLRFRNGGLISGFVKRFVEQWAIDRCLNRLKDVKTICDCPCGPGRLFPYWKKRQFRVIGAELSEPMISAARQMHTDLGLHGYVLKADAFDLDQEVGEVPDMVASVRFCYYFDSNVRIKLIRTLASISRRYLLLQYKTKETLKGQRNTSSSKMQKRSHRSSKHYSTNQEIIDELQTAGLKCLRIENISQASDFSFVLAEKTNGKVY